LTARIAVLLRARHPRLGPARTLAGNKTGRRPRGRRVLPAPPARVDGPPPRPEGPAAGRTASAADERVGGRARGRRAARRHPFTSRRRIAASEIERPPGRHPRRGTYPQAGCPWRPTP